jgi:hypothetical protein
MWFEETWNHWALFKLNGFTTQNIVLFNHCNENLKFSTVLYYTLLNATVN